MRKHSEPPVPETPAPSIEEPPPFKPDPDLITYLERGARPDQVRVWVPEEER